MIKAAFFSILVLAGGLVAAQDDSRDVALDLRQNWQEIEEIAGERDQTPAGEERDVLSARISRRARSVRSDLRALIKRIEEAEENGDDASADRAVGEEILVAASPLIRREIEHRREVVEARQSDREERPPEEHLELERQLTRDNQELDATMSMLLEIVAWKETLSLDATDDEAYLDPILEERADDLMARTALALRRRDEAEERLAGASDDEKSSAEPAVQVAREALHGNVASLEAMVAMMDERGFDATEHKELLISHELVLEEPPPTVKLHELGDSSVNFVVRPWVKTKDYWDVHWDITRAVKERFDAEGISIPYPQRDVHVHRESTPSEPHEPNPRAVEHTEPREAVPATGIAAEDD